MHKVSRETDLRRQKLSTNPIQDSASTMYVCPDCRSPLVGLRCEQCACAFPCLFGYPKLLPNGPGFASARGVVDAYEEIYAEHANVWENQGRSKEFIRYFAGILNSFQPRRILEVGCGEGLVLAASDAAEKHATELSVRALQVSNARTQAQFSLALCERLPYSDAAFDLVTSVGVMEHFLDDHAATREIFRVLDAGGRYVLLIHVHLTPLQSLRQKVSEYIVPRPRPLGLARWLVGKLHKPIHQPVQNNYSIDSATACLNDAGFVVERRITKASAPKAPLIGPHVVIFVCRKTAMPSAVAKESLV